MAGLIFTKKNLKYIFEMKDDSLVKVSYYENDKRIRSSSNKLLDAMTLCNSLKENEFERFGGHV